MKYCTSFSAVSSTSEKMYQEAATEKTNTTHINNVAILGDSIISFNWGIKSEFDKTMRSRWARFKLFLGASSKGLMHYIGSTLEEQNFEAAITHIGINDMIWQQFPANKFTSSKY